MAKAMAGRRFGYARSPDRRPKYPLHDGRVQVVTSEETGAGIDVLPRRREDPMPAQFPRRPRVLPLQGIREGDGSASVNQVPVVPAADPLELLSERVHELSWEDRLPVLATLAVPHHQHAPAEVDVLDSQSEAFLQPQTAAVHQGCDQPQAPRQPAEQGPYLVPAQDDRQPNRALGARGVVEPFHLPLEHLSEQEEKGAESLVLGGSAYLLPHRQVGEVGSDFGRAQEGGVVVTVEGHEPPDPPRVRLLGPAAVVPLPDRLPEALNQGAGCHRGPRGCASGRGAWLLVEAAALCR